MHFTNTRSFSRILTAAFYREMLAIYAACEAHALGCA